MANLLFVVGSTGGHLYPALSISQHCYKYSHNCYILAPESTKGKLNLENWNNIEFHKDLHIKTPYFILDFFKDIRASIRNIIEKKIDVVISFGSAFCLPPSLAAKIKNKKLISIDQNVLPGRTTRLLSYISDIVVVPFEESKEYIKTRNVKVMLSPIREELLALEKGNENTLLFFGGSLGAKTINQLALKFIQNSNKIPKTIQNIIIISGNKLFESFIQEIKSLKNHKEISIKSDSVEIINNVKIVVYRYCSDMANLYRSSAIVICRAGGSTIAEILYLKKKAILIPYPYALDNHQLYNAEIASKYANFIDYVQEPVDFELVLKKLEKLLEIYPEYTREINFFKYDEFFTKVIQE